MQADRLERPLAFERFGRVRTLHQVYFAVRDIAFNWGVVIFTAYLHSAIVRRASDDWSTLLVGFFSTFSFLLIASRQHALLGLMHEAAHRHLLPGKWNDLVSDIFCAVPCFLVTRFYRLSHLAHHKFVNSLDDPDWNRKSWAFPKKTPLEFWSFVLREVVMAFVRRLTIFAASLIAQSKYSLSTFFYIIILAAAWSALVWYVIGWRSYLLYWLGPMALVLPFLGVIRSISEHFGLTYSGDLNQARDVVAGPVEKALFGPNTINLHLTHHLFPRVPRYHLRELHRVLVEEEWFKAAKQNTSYIFPSDNSVYADVISGGSAGQEKN